VTQDECKTNGSPTSQLAKHRSLCQIGYRTNKEFTRMTTQEDNRNYFRLGNHVGIAAYPLDPNLPEDYFADAYDPRLQVPPILSLLNQSRESQIDNNNLLKQIRGKNANVGRYLERMNDRLDLLQKAILYIDKSFPRLSWQWAEYSEAGIDFLIPHTASQYPSPLEHHTSLREAGHRVINLGKDDLRPTQSIHLILGIPTADLDQEQSTAILPSDHLMYQPHFAPAGYISVVAHIKSIVDETAALRVGCAFDQITDFDRQFLARHILAVQSFRRRQSLNNEY
tara:strand:- start:35827 stop:36672 length:846 start_codon:yes stop_codon:yes gene_type:complete